MGSEVHQTLDLKQNGSPVAGSRKGNVGTRSDVIDGVISKVAT